MASYLTRRTWLLFVVIFAVSVAAARAQVVTRDIHYATAHERQMLDVHAPAGAKNLPVVFWIHGGGWQTGDKSMVALKPKAFMDAASASGRSTIARRRPAARAPSPPTDPARRAGVTGNIAPHGVTRGE